MSRRLPSLCFPVWRVFAAESAILIKFKLIRCSTLVLGCRIISSFAFCACKSNNYSHRISPLTLFYDVANHPGPNRAASLAYRKAQLLLHGYRCDQLRLYGYIISGHHHLHSLR